MKIPSAGTGEYDTARGDAANGMKSFLTIAEYILEHHGPMEPSALAEQSLRVARAPEPPEALTAAAARLGRTTRNAQSLSWSLLRSALTTGHGLAVIEYPQYRLRAETRPRWLGRVGWAGAAYKVLLASKGTWDSGRFLTRLFEPPSSASTPAVRNISSTATSRTGGARRSSHKRAHFELDSNGGSHRELGRSQEPLANGQWKRLRCSRKFMKRI